jgi:hypothetical protein
MLWCTNQASANQGLMIGAKPSLAGSGRPGENTTVRDSDACKARVGMAAHWASIASGGAVNLSDSGA